MQFNVYSLFENFRSKDYTVEATLSFLKILKKRQSGSTGIVFFYQNKIGFNPYSLLKNF